MIRFACPGCGAIYTVDNSKGGKTGKCPKCQGQFIIPMPEAEASKPASVEASAPASPPKMPEPPPLPSEQTASAEETVEVAPCPTCQMRLTVLRSDLGKDVECPGCQSVFTARLASEMPPVPPPAPPKLSRFEDSGRRRNEDDDEDEDRPRKSKYRDEDDDEDERPRKKKKKRRYNQESKRVVAGVLALLLGAFGVHKFYLGYTNAGILMILLSCCTGTGSIIALIEGIIYLTKSDEEFIETYQIGTKEWF